MQGSRFRFKCTSRRILLACRIAPAEDPDPDDGQLWKRLMRAVEAAKDPDVEIEVLGRYLTAKGGDAALRNRLIRLLNDQGRTAETIPHLRAIAEGDPTNLKHWNRLLRVLTAVFLHEFSHTRLTPALAPVFQAAGRLRKMEDDFSDDRL